MNFSANIRGAEKTGPEEVLGGPKHSGPANTLTIEDAMAASIIRLEQENQELRARVALLEEEQKILAKGHQGHAKAAVTEGGTGFSGAERPEPSPHLRIGGREMTNEQINIAIAEACGWRNIREQDDIDAVGNVMAGAWWFGKPPHGGDDNLLPNYCTDPAAMAAAVNTLGLAYDRWTRELREICERNRRCIESATARQRAEAFLRTIGKWEEAAK